MAVVVGRIILGGEKWLGSLLLCGPFQVASDGIFEGVGPGEGDPLGVT